MKTNNIILLTFVVFALIITGYYFALQTSSPERTAIPMDSLPMNVNISGSYVCLPYLDKDRAPSEECVFGLKTDDGVYYMVNFGASASAMKEFQERKHIKAKGFVVLKEALNTDQWVPYNMKGIFTITEKY